MAGEDKDMLEAAVGTKIAWKQGKDPTVKVLSRLDTQCILQPVRSCMRQVAWTFCGRVREF